MSFGITDAELGFRAACFGAPTQGQMDRIRNDWQGGWESMTARGKEFFQDTARFVEEHTSEEFVRRARAVGRKVRHMWDDDDIKSLSELGSMQQAKPQMQRWLMAEPLARQLHNQQRIDGYSDSYVNFDRSSVKRDDRDWNIVTEGMIQVDDDDEAYFVSYWDSHMEDDNVELDGDQTLDIMDSWEHIRYRLLLGKSDPTNKHNGNM